ncbi:MAG: lamin tail domain-containing protein, partial [Phycisphaerales bacterium]|nr:lamin tail domain-containing protein [Phycisphaerales bacterium]
DFNRTPGVPPSFTLSSHGDELYLYSADANGNLTGFSDGFSFSAAGNGVSFGRHTIGTGEIHYPAQTSNSLGAANTGPRIGPIVINEIHYQPSPGGDEFVELKNVTSSPVQLYDPAHATNAWSLDGVGFDFPPNTVIPAQGLLLVVASDPAAFRTRYNVPPAVPVFGPYAGVLQDSGELLQLQRPDAPDVETDGTVIVPRVTVDEIRFNDKAPWPTNAAGGGSSLERLNANAYGNDPVAWRGSPGPPSPGWENTGNRPPQVTAGLDLKLQTTALPVSANLAGSASDDGSPKPPGALASIWSQVSGPGTAVFGTADRLSTSVSFPGVGTFVLRLAVTDG